METGGARHGIRRGLAHFNAGRHQFNMHGRDMLAAHLKAMLEQRSLAQVPCRPARLDTVLEAGFGQHDVYSLGITQTGFLRRRFLFCQKTAV
jgi:hypothetical protein